MGVWGAYNHITFIYIFHYWQFFLCACGAVRRQQGVNLATGGSSKSLFRWQYSTSGGSDSGQVQSLSIGWSVDRRRTGTIICSVDRRRIGAIRIVIAGIAALSVCRWYVAVRCQRQMDCRRNSTIVQSIVCGSTVPAQGQFRRQISTESCYQVGLQAYQYKILSGSQAYQYKTCQFMFAGISVRYLIIIIFLTETQNISRGRGFQLINFT